jgi:AcrR family transcriptional regulator
MTSAKPAASPKKKPATKAAPLDRQAWLRAAAKALAASGVEAVRVEPLAQALGVTKGSFYWHFRDREALLDGLLGHWEQVATLGVIDLVDADGGSPAQRLERLIGLGARYDRTATEAAIRAWALHDARTAAAVARVDARRSSYVEDLLRGSGLRPAEARDRSYLVVLAFAGAMMTTAKGRDLRSFWASVHRLLLQP